MNIVIQATQNEQKFINGYLEAIAFTETGESEQPEHGTQLTEESLRDAYLDCLAFYNAHSYHINTFDIEQAGHDFWLTRNRLGAGFCDRPEIYGKYPALKLTTLSEALGQYSPTFEGEEL